MSTDSETYRGPGAEPLLAWIARHPGPWFAVVWLPVLTIGPLVDAFAGGDLLQGSALVLLGAVFAATVFLPYRSIGRRIRRRAVAELTFVLFTVLGTAYFVAWRADREFIFPLLAIAAAVAIRRRWALGFVWGLAASGACAVGFEQWSLNAAMFLGFATFFAGAANFLVLYLVDLVAELTRTQQRLANAAVAEERLRFSRDLHDLLGHTLSVIVVKAEAVRRLLASDTVAAAQHAANIESIGRHALAEVRDAVTGYRSVSLGDEIEGARAALAAGDVQLDVALQRGRGLEAQMDSLLGWVVREATTNVLRHAAATRCHIAVTHEDRVVRVEIIDNGRGSTGADGSGRDSSGLRGLTERVEDAGGELTTVATAGGFRLTVSIPDHSTAGGW